MTGFLTNRMVQLAFGSAVAILLLVGGLSYRSVVVTRENTHWVQHTHEVLETLDELQFAMETITSSVRGYLLVKDEVLSRSLPHCQIKSGAAYNGRPRHDGR